MLKLNFYKESSFNKKEVVTLIKEIENNNFRKLHEVTYDIEEPFSKKRLCFDTFFQSPLILPIDDLTNDTTSLIIMIYNHRVERIISTVNECTFYFEKVFEIENKSQEINAKRDFKLSIKLKNHLENLIKFKAYIERQEQKIINNEFQISDEDLPPNIERPISTNSKPHLIWNGNKNVLVDVFYQLKNNIRKDGKPILEASNENLSVFLKQNFSCFKDTQLKTIMKYFEEEQKRPQMGTNKLTIIEGFPD